MVEVSAIEHTLENQRIGGLQLRVAALCTLVQLCDGYDLNAVAWAVPSLIHQWRLPPSAFTVAFLWSSIGIMVGALSAGPIGDRFGRRPLLLTALTIFGVASLASTVAGSLGMLSVLRFFTGLGIGGGFSGAAALTGDYTPRRLRATMIMATFTGAPAGGFLGGQLVAALLPHFGWPVIFIIGSVFPLVLVVMLAVWLRNRRAFWPPGRCCRHARPASCAASASCRSRAAPPISRKAIRSPCCSAKTMPCRPRCCGSSIFAACWTCSCSRTGCRRS